MADKRLDSMRAIPSFDGNASLFTLPWIVLGAFMYAAVLYVLKRGTTNLLDLITVGVVR
jgi:predicted ABC-type sugar transport system permease subunit